MFQALSARETVTTVPDVALRKVFASLCDDLGCCGGHGTASLLGNTRTGESTRWGGCVLSLASGWRWVAMSQTIVM